jgi:hypothetical protein
MADAILFLEHGATSKIPIKVFDNGDGTYSMQAGTDAVNDLLKTGEKHTAGALTGAADGATITGVGVLRKLIISNGSGAAITVNVYDNTAASGTKLMPTLHVPTLTDKSWDVAIPFSIGVFIDFSTPTSCDAIGYYQAVS